MFVRSALFDALLAGSYQHPAMTCMRVLSMWLWKWWCWASVVMSNSGSSKRCLSRVRSCSWIHRGLSCPYLTSAHPTSDDHASRESERDTYGIRVSPITFSVLTIARLPWPWKKSRTWSTAGPERCLCQNSQWAGARFGGVCVRFVHAAGQLEEPSVRGLASQPPENLGIFLIL